MVEVVELPTVGTVGDYEVQVQTDRKIVSGQARTVVTSVTVTFTEGASDDALARGINSGTLRKVGPLLQELTAKAKADDATALEDYAARAERAIRRLQRHEGRADAKYRVDLLNASECLQLAGDHHHLATLSRRLNTSHGTINNQLRQARAERASYIEEGKREGLI